MNEEFKYYMPSNGTEGCWFTAQWCERCRKDTSFRKEDAKVFCGILTASWMGEQPKQWIYDEESNPICTAFVNYKTYTPKSKRTKKGQLSITY